MSLKDLMAEILYESGIDPDDAYRYATRMMECVSLHGTRLTNPVHLDLATAGYGEYPDTFTLSDQGAKRILDSLKVKDVKLSTQYVFAGESDI